MALKDSNISLWELCFFQSLHKIIALVTNFDSCNRLLLPPYKINGILDTLNHPRWLRSFYHL